MKRTTSSARAEAAPITHAALSRAMKKNVVAGTLGNIWITVCSTQPLFFVFVQNHLGASSATIGLILGLVQLSGLFQLASIFIYGNLDRRKPFFIAAHLVHRCLGLVVAGSAFWVALGGPKDRAVLAVVTAVTISYCFMNVSASGWWSWVADLFPEDIRGTFFMRRSSIIQVVTVVWFLLATVMLDIFPKELTFFVYGFIIGIGAVAGIVDIVINIFIPEPAPKVRTPPPSLKDFVRPLKDRNFIFFAFAVGFAEFSMYLVSPFQSPYVTDPAGVGAPNIWLGIQNVISQMMWVIIAPLWGVVMDRYGRKPVVLMGCLLSVSWIGYLFLTSGNYVLLLPLISLVYGFFAPAFWEGINQMMLTLARSDNRVSYIAWYNAVVGLVSAFGSVIGGYLKDALSGVRFTVLSMHCTSFHIVQTLSILLVGVSMLVLNRIREGKEKPFGFVAAQLMNAGLFRTYNSYETLARGPDSDQVAHALRSIQDNSGTLVLKEVLERLDDPVPEVREEAARALGRIRNPEAVDALTRQLVNPDSTIRIEAARALGRIGDRRAVSVLAEGLLASSPELKSACAEALGLIGDDEAIRALLVAFKEEQPRSVMVMGTEAASRQTRAATGENRLEVFEAAWEIFPRFLSTPNSVLRKQYAVTLGNLLGTPGEFYQYVTGDEAEQSLRTKALFERFRANVTSILAGHPAAGMPLAGMQRRLGKSAKLLHELDPLFASCGEKIERDDYPAALADFFAISDRFMESIFGKQSAAQDFFAYAVRMDMKLGTWCWLVRESEKRSGGFDTEVGKLILLLGLYYLSEY